MALPKPQLVTELMQKGWVWQGAETALEPTDTLQSSGLPALDQVLGGGWPLGGVHEIQCTQWYQQELALILPLLRNTQAPCLWVNPPADPYPPGWSFQGIDSAQQWIVRCPIAQLAWTLQHAVQAGCCPFILVWCEGLSATTVRQLQLCAAAQHVSVFVFSLQQASGEARAYVSRLSVCRKTPQDQVVVAIRKRRYGWPLADAKVNLAQFFPVRRTKQQKNLQQGLQ